MNIALQYYWPRISFPVLAIFIVLSVGVLTSNIYGQQTQRYSAEIKKNANDEMYINVNSVAQLNIGVLSQDSVLLKPDTLLYNRLLNFTISDPNCDDLVVSLKNQESNQLYGYRIIDNKVVLVVGNMNIEGPFNGTDSLNNSVLVTNLVENVSDFEIEFIEPELTFRLDNIVVFRGCVGFHLHPLAQFLLPSDDTEAELIIEFIEW